MLYKGDKKARLYKGEAHPSEWYKGSDKITGFTTESKSGEHIEFSDSYNGKFDELTVYGMSEQKSYAGTNFFDIRTMRNSYPNLFTFNADGSITIKGETPSRFWSCASPWFDRALTDYTIVNDCKDGEVWFGAYLSKNATEATQVQLYVYGEGFSVITNAKYPMSEYPYMRYFVGCRTAKGYDVTLHPQLNKGQTPLPYEPYVGGRAAPNMDFPQPIVDLEAETAVAGRNLIPYPYAGGAYVENKGIIWTVKPDGTIVADGTNTSNDNAYYNVVLNQNNRRIPMKKGTYTISSSRAGIYVAGGFRDSAGNIVNATNGSPSFNISNGSTYTFTVNEDFELFMYLFIAKGVTVNNAELKVMIEPGTTHAKYEPYRDPQEIAITARGIPVPSNGNYTDANGQQWYCDTVDLARGKYIQRVKHMDVELRKDAPYRTAYGYRWICTNLTGMAQVHSQTADMMLCDKLPFNANCGTTVLPDGKGDGIRMSGSYKTVVAEFKDDEHDRVTLNVAYMINPVETDLDAFTTLFPTTIIDSNTDRVTATAKVVDGGTT